MRPIRIVLVEDQSLVRDALAALLSLQPGIDVVGQAGAGSDGVRVVAATRPDVALLDVQIPDGDGLWAAHEITTSLVGVKCLLLTTFAKDEYLAEGLAAGAQGYVLKDTPVKDVVAAIEVVAAGGTWIAPAMQGRLKDLLTRERLTARERDVLRIAEGGATNREIAASLFLAEGSVKNVWTEILRKLWAKNRVEAIARARARARGII